MRVSEREREKKRGIIKGKGNDSKEGRKVSKSDGKIYKNSYE